MSRPMIQSAVTMNQLQQKLDLIGHNLANSETTGYKGKHAAFSSLLFQQINNLRDPANAEGRLTPDGIRVGSGARLGAINTDFSAGPLQTTDRALDVALLEDNHLFQIQISEDGTEETHYTRDGSFYLNPINDQTIMLTTKDGHPVLGSNGPITMADDFDDIRIESSGDIIVSRGMEGEVVGQLDIVEAALERTFEATGQNAFRIPDLEALKLNMNYIIRYVPLTTDIVQSGTLEQSNVNLSEQMTEMMIAERTYQFNSRTISMGDQMLGLINQLR